jgi:GTPase SAR1 family protein
MKLHIWDTFGVDKRVSGPASMYYKISQAAIFVYSVDSKSSLKEIESRVDFFDS